MTPACLEPLALTKISKIATIKNCLKCMLFNSQEGIPRLADILDLVARKVPLIVEIKSESRDVLEVCQRVTSYLNSYTGTFMVESFNPWLSPILRNIALTIFVDNCLVI